MLARGRFSTDVVAGFERCAVEQLADDTCLRVAEHDAGLLRLVVGEEIVEAIIVYVLEMTALFVRGCSPVGPEGQGVGA